MKKYRNVMNTRMTHIVTKIDDINKKKNSLEINYGQLAALAQTNVAKGIGLTEALISQDNTII